MLESVLGLFFHRMIRIPSTAVSALRPTKVYFLNHFQQPLYVGNCSICRVLGHLFDLRMRERWVKHSKNSVPFKTTKQEGTGFVVFILYFCERNNVFTCPVPIFIWLFSLEINLKILSPSGRAMYFFSNSPKLPFLIWFLSTYF